MKAAGIESIQLPFMPDPAAATEAAKAKLDKAAAEFENSEFLKGLRERSEQNREKYAPQHHSSNYTPVLDVNCTAF